MMIEALSNNRIVYQTAPPELGDNPEKYASAVASADVSESSDRQCITTDLMKSYVANALGKETVTDDESRAHVESNGIWSLFAANNVTKFRFDYNGESFYIDLTSKGDMALTNDEALYLKNKYGSDNMSTSEMLGLLSELSSMGVLSADDAWRQATDIWMAATLPDDISPSSSTNELSGFDAWLEWYIEKMTNAENALDDYIKNRGNSLITLETARKNVSHWSRLADVLSQISGSGSSQE